MNASSHSTAKNNAAAICGIRSTCTDCAGERRNEVMPAARSKRKRLKPLRRPGSDSSRQPPGARARIVLHARRFVRLPLPTPEPIGSHVPPCGFRAATLPLRLATPGARASVSPRAIEGFWTRDLECSPSATAAAVSALVVAEQHFDDVPQIGPPMNDSWTPGALFRGEFTQLVVQNLRWLAERQNEDGGWPDAEGGRSSLAATLLVEAAYQVTGVPAKASGLLERAEAFVQSAGGVKAFREQYKDDPR